MIQKDPPPWRQVFLELAVRALRRLNYEFAPWTIGQSLHIDVTPRLEMINSSDGLRYVLETEVCSAITVEFLYSGFTNGCWIFNESKRYAIDREILIGGKRVDLFVNKYEIDNGINKYSAHPVLIEAKRREYFRPNLREGESRGSDNFDGIKSDIDKLRTARTHIQKGGKIGGYEDFDFDGAYIYVMFWGTTDAPNNVEANIAKDLEFLGKETKNCSIKYFPTKWTQSGPAVTEWGWVCLHEIDPPENPVRVIKELRLNPDVPHQD